MKIIKLTDYSYVGLRVVDGEAYICFRNKYNDLEMIKKCKVVSRDGKSVEHLSTVNGKVVQTHRINTGH